MKSTIRIDKNSLVPVYRQIVSAIDSMIEAGTLKEGDVLPSMNELAEKLEISKETTKKAYLVLRDEGKIESKQGKGFYVKADGGAKKLKVLAIFDKLSTYKQILFSSMLETLDNHAEITIRLHEQNVDMLEYFIHENLDNFDYYVITPHFPLDRATQKRVCALLGKIPNRKLLMLDNWMREIHGNFGAVYQDWENDTAKGLAEGLDTLRGYKQLNVITLPSSLYSKSIRMGVERFCNENGIKVRFADKVSRDMVHKGEVYLLLTGQYDFDLIELVRIAREKKLEVGKDIGLISYNESPLCEIILNGLTTVSTDFDQMGRLAGEMILERSLAKRHCDFRMTRRASF